MEPVNPHEGFDARLMELFGSDPATAVMSQPKVVVKVPGTSFDLSAPPVTKENIPSPEPTQEAQPNPEQPEIESPFIQEPPKTAIKVTEDAKIDWKDEADNIIEVLDILQSSVFGYVAAAKGEEKNMFKLSKEDRTNLNRFLKPTAEKHNIKVSPEWGLGIVGLEILVRNTEAAIQMRKAKKEAAMANARAEALERKLLEVQRAAEQQKPKQQNEGNLQVVKE